jgi:hypothetical protein
MSVTETIGVRKVSVPLPDTPNQKGIMSSVHLYETTKHKADLKHRDYGFVLALICVALALVVASAIFARCLSEAKLATKCHSSVLNSAEPILLGPSRRRPIFYSDRGECRQAARVATKDLKSYSTHKPSK